MRTCMVWAGTHAAVAIGLVLVPSCDEQSLSKAARRLHTIFSLRRAHHWAHSSTVCVNSPRLLIVMEFLLFG